MGDDGRRRDLGLKRRINGRMVSARIVYLFAKFVFFYIKMYSLQPYVPFEPSTLVWIFGDKQGQTLSHNFQWGELGKSDFHQSNWRNWRNSEKCDHVTLRLSATTRTTTFPIEPLSAQRECSARARQIATYCITTQRPSRGPCGRDGWEDATVEEAKEEAGEGSRRRPSRHVDLAVGWANGE